MTVTTKPWRTLTPGDHVLGRNAGTVDHVEAAPNGSPGVLIRYTDGSRRVVVDPDEQVCVRGGTEGGEGL